MYTVGRLNITQFLATKTPTEECRSKHFPMSGAGSVQEGGDHEPKKSRQVGQSGRLFSHFYCVPLRDYGRATFRMWRGGRRDCHFTITFHHCCGQRVLFSHGHPDQRNLRMHCHGYRHGRLQYCCYLVGRPVEHRNRNQFRRIHANRRGNGDHHRNLNTRSH